jgi:branched-subunit amino acid transport protein
MIAGAALVTFIPRVAPLVFLSRVSLPKRVEEWLQFIPTAVLAALLAQELFLQEKTSYSDWIAAAIAFGIAFATRSLLITVLAGMIAVMLMRYIL